MALPGSARHARLLLRMTFGAFLSAAALVPPLAEGKIREPRSLGELARDADLIVIGRVRAVIPSLTSPAGIVLIGALTGGAFYLLLHGRVRRRLAIGKSLLVFLVIAVLGPLVVAGGPWSFKCHRRIAIVDVDRWIAGSSASRIPVSFRSYFICDATKLEVGARYLLFLEPRGLGYRMSWYDYSAWKETAEGFHCWRGPGSNGSQPEEDLVRELLHLGSGN